MARAALDWSRGELAKRSGVGQATIADFETNRRTPYDRTIKEIEQAFNEAGISFLDEDSRQVTGPGVSYDPNFVITE